MWHEVIETIAKILELQLFTFGKTPITIARILTFVAVLLITMLISKGIRSALETTLKRRHLSTEGHVGVFSRLAHYGMLIIGLTVGFQVIGINLDTLFAAGALVAVGIGFALQTLTQNFVSGIILLLERAIKPGDILEVDGRVVKVEDLGIRSTIVRTLDEEHLIVPNGLLVQTSVKNFTLRDRVYRLRATVGVSYSSDLDLVISALTEAAKGLEIRIAEREPMVLLSDFGDSSVDFEVSIWIADPWAMRRIRSELLLAIWRSLHAAEVVIAFPQIDVHLDPEVVGALGAKRAA